MRPRSAFLVDARRRSVYMPYHQRVTVRIRDPEFAARHAERIHDRACSDAGARQFVVLRCHVLQRRYRRDASLRFDRAEGKVARSQRVCVLGLTELEPTPISAFSGGDDGVPLQLPASAAQSGVTFSRRHSRSVRTMLNRRASHLAPVEPAVRARC